MKKYVAILLALVICVGTLSFQATATAEASGTFGNLSWVLDAEGTLTISGEGEMDSVGNDEAWKQYNGDIKTVDIKDGVTSVGNNAFEDCAALTSIAIPNSVTSIGSYAFEDCALLASITIPDSVISIGSGAFFGCSSLTSVAIPTNVTHIGHYTFCECASIISITIPNGVTGIGSYAFENCTSLESINIPNSVTSIGRSAFEDCTSLANVSLPNGITSISESAFKHCTSLESIAIPNGVTSVSKSAFNRCTSLTSISIPDSVTSIGTGAFNSTAYYKDKSNWENGALYIDNCLIKVSGDLEGELRLKSGTRLIADYAFEDSTLLTSIAMPNSVANVGIDAFVDCTSLETVHYDGFEEEWQQISIADGNDPLKNANIVFKPRYTLGDVNDDGEIDNLDAAMILKYDAGIINGF